MSKITIPFGPYQPDLASYRNPGLVSVNNLVPKPGSYGPLRELSTLSNALDTRCFGSVSARDSNNSVFVYAGDAAKLYELVDGTFSDQSKAGGYSLATDDVWEFAIWNRNGKIIATNYSDPVQSMNIGAGSTSNFADMITSTNKPKAKHIAIIGQFVVLGNTTDSTDGNRISRVWWSGLGDETDFDPDAATQSDYEDLSSGGSVQRIIGGTQYGLVFQNEIVRAMQYVGPGAVFEFDPINYAPGTPIPNSAVSHKGRVFYIAEDGFFGIEGGQVTPIGSGQVDKHFWDQFDIGNKRSVSTAVDPVKKLICWAFAGSGATSDLPNKILVYKYDENKWAEWNVDLEWLLRSETQGWTLDGLDVLGTDIDDAAVFDLSLDSDKWRGGALRFGAFDQNHKLSFFTGPIRKGSIDTGDFQPSAGMRWQTNSVRPLIDGSSVDVSIASRSVLSDAVSYGSAKTVNSEGYCPVRVEGRYQRYRTSITSSATWSHIQGLEIDFETMGGR